MKRISIAVAVSLISLPAFAFDPSMQMTGWAFSDACTRANESWISFCNGYIQAAVDGLRPDDGICIPNGTTRTELVTITEKEITATSQLRTMNAYLAVRLILRHYYPCS